MRRFELFGSRMSFLETLKALVDLSIALLTCPNAGNGALNAVRILVGNLRQPLSPSSCFLSKNLLTLSRSRRSGLVW